MKYLCGYVFLQRYAVIKPLPKDAEEIKALVEQLYAGMVKREEEAVRKMQMVIELATGDDCESSFGLCVPKLCSAHDVRSLMICLDRHRTGVCIVFWRRGRGPWWDVREVHVLYKRSRGRVSLSFLYRLDHGRRCVYHPCRGRKPHQRHSASLSGARRCAPPGAHGLRDHLAPPHRRKMVDLAPALREHGRRQLQRARGGVRGGVREGGIYPLACGPDPAPRAQVLWGRGEEVL